MTLAILIKLMLMLWGVDPSAYAKEGFVILCAIFALPEVVLIAIAIDKTIDIIKAKRHVKKSNKGGFRK